MTVLRDSESTQDLYPLFGWDGALKRNRELLDGMVHTSSFGNILLSCRDVATADREKHLNHISTLLRSFFTIHLGFVFHLNSHYMMASDYVEYQEVGETPPVVAVKLVDGWRMPTKGEQDELRAYCTWKWTTRNGVPGCEVTSTINEATLFFPPLTQKSALAAPDPLSVVGPAPLAPATPASPASSAETTHPSPKAAHIGAMATR